MGGAELWRVCMVTVMSWEVQRCGECEVTVMAWEVKQLLSLVAASLIAVTRRAVGPVPGAP